ncbi:tyrosyl-DNA phosphodiesterase 2-like [Amphiura filiformis]|uniref:tyrosyl-DNA phosphodiesterase 2-like n=1 Tax=Amphiura filiformis TaxID=82378 RepID=UPI003B21C364
MASAASFSYAAALTSTVRNKFSLMTWNTAGLDHEPDELRECTLAQCEEVKMYSPDVVYLQEVTPSTCGLLRSTLQDYKMIPATEGRYFTAILLKNSSVQHLSGSIETFFGSKQGRQLQTVRAKCADAELTLMCSHLESQGKSAGERVRQLKTVFERIAEASSNSAVIFGGDLNLRDKEVTKAGGLPNGVFDIWSLCGEPPDAEFTWDPTQNDKLEFPFKMTAKCRFDRLYLKQGTASGLKVVPERFMLVGKKRLPVCETFPSDHWGIVCDFKVEETK